MFAPVAKMTSLRVILAVAAHNSWMDVNAAFLKGNIDIVIYIVQTWIKIIQVCVAGSKRACMALNKPVSYGIPLLVVTCLRSALKRRMPTLCLRAGVQFEHLCYWSLR